NDVDLDNDGVLDAAASLTPIDGVGWTRVDNSTNAVYGGAPRLTVAPDGSDVPDAATRVSTNINQMSLAAWYWGNIAGPSRASITYTTPRGGAISSGGGLSPGLPNSP